MKTNVISVWFVDPMDRVYPDVIPSFDPDAGKLYAVTGGCSAVIVSFRTDKPGRVHLTFEGFEEKSGLSDPEIYVLKPVKVHSNTVRICKQARYDPKQAPYLLRRAPFRVLEALWEGDEIETRGKTTEGFLMLFEVPKDAKPGIFRFSVKIIGQQKTEVISGSISIYKWNAPAQKLKVTNWVNPARLLYPYPDVKPWSEEHWRIIRQTLRILKKGRQNVILLPYFGLNWFYTTARECEGNLIDVKEKGDGYTFNFQRLDRFAGMAVDMGYDFLEGGHIAGKKNLKDNELWLKVGLTDSIKIINVPTESEESKKFLTAFFTSLKRHIEKRGWQDIYFQHIADEPFKAVSESFVRTAVMIRSLLPGIKLLDAASTHSAAYALDIPVPEIDYLEPHKEFYREMVKQGKELWFYVCCCPIGPWPNRFLDFHLNKGSLLPWFNFHYGAEGFLHWGAAQWPRNADLYKDPGFQGDGWILAPGKNGPVPTMRWLALRFGVDDYEMLAYLKEKGHSGIANKLLKSLIKSPIDFIYDTVAVRNVRKKLRMEVSKTSRDG